MLHGRHDRKTTRRIGPLAKRPATSILSDWRAFSKIIGTSRVAASAHFPKFVPHHSAHLGKILPQALQELQKGGTNPRPRPCQRRSTEGFRNRHTTGRAPCWRRAWRPTARRCSRGGA